ncbi:protein inturned isoform X2 [Orussus abietinus]|uniref:protein inturned isoform X2 n=1 Tax=Orussus abietinus TaxID=222816 RepID=UPI000626EB76|nr:protein inturned isoform X2 [Orussus abietinus]
MRSHDPARYFERMNETDQKRLLQSEDKRVGQIDDLNNTQQDKEDPDWWASDSGSTSESYYSDTDSSVVEWESEIGAMGEVFYIESLVDCFNNEENVKKDTSKSPPCELTRRRSTRAGKLMRLIRRRESKRYSCKRKSLNLAAENSASGNNKEGNSTKEVTFRDCQAGEIRDVTLWIDTDKRHKLGRRATLCEAYLGIIPGVFSDKVRVMVAGFIPDGEAIKNKSIKIGDWLRSINARNITFQNLEQTLSGISGLISVRLELQRIAGIDVTANLPENNFPKQSPSVQQLVDKEGSKHLMESLLNYSLGVIYLKTTGLPETGPELQGMLYTFPQLESRSVNSILFLSRGAFITLDHMLPGIAGLQPISTTIRVSKEDVHVVYTPRGTELLLIAFPDKCCSLQEAVELNADIVRVLEFCHQTLSKCFSEEENHCSLDHFFTLNFFYLLRTKDLTVDIDLNKTFPEVQDEGNNTKKYEFESIMSAAHHVRLPRDAQIQIDAALNEMEAMDYRDWNEDPMDCQRLYTILGSCLYHKSYLLGSHLPHEDLIEVHSFLRRNGLLSLISKEPLKTLVIWRKVYPLSCGRGHLDGASRALQVPNGQWFLLVVGYDHELLAVLLESGGCTAKLKENTGPDIFYVEEAQETLRHIQKIGVPALVAKWLSANARPETVILDDRSAIKSATSITENLLGLIKSSDAQTSSVKPNVNSTVGKKSQEVASILKKRNPEQSPIRSNSTYSLQTSEDSMSQGTGAISEVSDEAVPILGRRATREKNNALSRHSDDSDSDVDIYRNDCQTNTMDISDIRESLLTQAEYIIPKKLTSGENNYLFHYVHLDMLEGVLLSTKALSNSSKNESILYNFNKCAHVIHKLLNNNVRFKKMLSQEMDKSVINKSLIAIKEHGVMFDWEDVTYWVIGRLYTVPHPKELYVCYEDIAPQNLIEMAFRLDSMWN